ncbi:MAG: hypothetical protein ACO1OG_02845 [Devosia sp.]
MAFKDIFAPIRKRAQRKPVRVWTETMSSRDWADLPTHHPRREEDAV